jgi:GT2 family glycosyltransferase
MGDAVSQVSLVSFVVIAYNEAGQIVSAITSITALEGLGAYEVIVVDDGSRDETAQIVADIAQHDQHIRLIRCRGNHGRGYARRKGVGAAHGEFVATIDADIILPSDWLLRARAAIRDHDAVGGTAVPDGDVAYIYRRFGLAPRIVGHTTAVTGSNALYRHEIFDEVNFDPALREGEDVALNVALKRSGLSAVTVPGLVATHQEKKGLGASLRSLFNTGRGATRQLVAYRMIRQPDVVTCAFISTVGLGLSAVARGHRIAGAGIPAGFLLVTSIAHVRSGFDIARSRRFQVVLAVATDCGMLMAYFAGRIAGLTSPATWSRPGRPGEPDQAAARGHDAGECLPTRARVAGRGPGHRPGFGKARR